MKTRFAILLVVALLVLTLPLVSAEPVRTALVVGNGAYQTGPLENPANDASDVAQVLTEAGFDVTLRVDRSLTQMEADLRGFKESIGKGDTALFFYAGHGVQVDGENYLLPVDNGNIRASGELRRRAVNAEEYVTAMTEAGAKLNIVMLDACRDNPLPSASRSANRGLAVMSAPRNSETVIVFATKAGDVASDGVGRNSTFTKAFLDTVSTPDLDLVNLFNVVGSKVRSSTGGMQIPTIYSEPISAPFAFFSSGRLAAEARAESDAAKAEVDSLEADIAALKAKIEASRSAEERHKLELEEQRQAALLAAQRMKAENLAREAERREAEASAARAEAERLAAEAEAAAARQTELERLASLRRTELEKLKSDAESEDPDLLIATIERLEKVLSEVEAEYDSAWRQSEREIRASFNQRLAALTEAEPEIWETDDEFKARISRERSGLNREIDTVVSRRKSEAEADKAAQTASIRTQLSDALASLSRKSWTLTGREVELTVGEYDRNNRAWPFTVESRSPAVPVPGWRVVKEFTNTATLRDDLIKLDATVKAGALAAEIEWRIDRKQEQVGGGYYGYAGSTVTKYYVVLRRIIIRDITASGAPVLTQWLRKPVAAFQPGKRSEPESLWGSVKISAKTGNPDIFIDGDFRGTAPLTLCLLKGECKAEAWWPDRNYLLKTLDVKSDIQNIVFDMSDSPVVFVEAGSFSMGTASGGDGDERPVHRVTVDSFFMTKTEITFEEYDRFARADRRDLPYDSGWGRGSRPVINVSWYDAAAYANWLSEQDGLAPAYRINGSTVTWDRSADGWRLPTEAEWEYAARGGAKSRGYRYAGSNTAGDVAWYDSNSGGKTQPVAGKKANELGLYDMSGNVWEWCWDWYGDYPSGSQTNPAGPASGSGRVLRGGGRYNSASHIRVASRSSGSPGGRYISYGFRLVRPSSP